MDNQSTNNPPVIPGWTAKEILELERAEREGAKPISAALAAQMFALFLEGYSCAEIAKQNKSFSEGDILFCRKKYQWDEEKDRYAFDLNKQIREKLAKAKLEAIEFLTNRVSVMNIASRQKDLKYIQTQKEEDLPKDWYLSPSAYKSIFETIQKITGEDRVSKQEVKTESTVTVNGTLPMAALHPELQAKMLQKLASISQEQPDKGGKDES